MDYSLLIGIHDIDKANEDKVESDDNFSPEDTEDTDDDQLNSLCFITKKRRLTTKFLLF